VLRLADSYSVYCAVAMSTDCSEAAIQCPAQVKLRHTLLHVNATSSMMITLGHCRWCHDHYGREDLRHMAIDMIHMKAAIDAAHVVSHITMPSVASRAMAGQYYLRESDIGFRSGVL